MTEIKYNSKCWILQFFVENYFYFYLLGEFIFILLFVFQGVSTRVVSSSPGSHDII